MKTTAHTVLLTGFEPFGGEPENPSLAIARALDRKRVAGHRIVGAALPTEFARSLPVLETLLRQHRPTLVLAVGQAGGRAQISLERVAINLIDARIATMPTTSRSTYRSSATARMPTFPLCR
jgi:pyroglutamyl-peptidase